MNSQTFFPAVVWKKPFSRPNRALRLEKRCTFPRNSTPQGDEKYLNNPGQADFLHFYVNEILPVNVL